MTVKPKKKIKPVAKKKKGGVKFKGEQVRTYHTDEEMLEHVRGYLGETHWKIVKNGIERRTFGNIHHCVFYFMLKPREPDLIPAYRYQIYDNGVPKSGGEIRGS